MRLYYEFLLGIFIYLSKIQIRMSGNLGCSNSIVTMWTALISKGVRRIEFIYHLSLLLNPLY